MVKICGAALICGVTRIGENKVPRILTDEITILESADSIEIGINTFLVKSAQQPVTADLEKFVLKIVGRLKPTAIETRFKSRLPSNREIMCSRQSCAKCITVLLHGIVKRFIIE